ncbi:hypothetical protein Bca4012_085161 [Brassica carinata]|uniref:Uncharacterized protein n=1 Tax=Brassica carinata TaxID=52824 RepID=A0A8X7SG27_BRACI|nr:hypothetical protein Bca52824_025380 [Brassica carinata]
MLGLPLHSPCTCNRPSKLQIDGSNTGESPGEDSKVILYRDHSTAVWELTKPCIAESLTTRNVCMPELTPVRINGEVMAGQLEFHVRPSVGLMCFGLCFALLCFTADLIR